MAFKDTVKARFASIAPSIASLPRTDSKGVLFTGWRASFYNHANGMIKGCVNATEATPELAIEKALAELGGKRPNKFSLTAGMALPDGGWHTVIDFGAGSTPEIRLTLR
jgi:hypothetical protein